jgi:hypothetical protein
MSEQKQSLLSQIIEKGMDAIKKPFVEKRVKRAFESAKDSIEEQLMDKEAALNTGREKLVEAAKREENLKSYIQTLIDLRVQIQDLKAAQEALSIEKEELL